MYQKITEGNAKLTVPKEKKVSKDLPVFYNPVMKYNRDVSVLLLNAVSNKNMQIGLPLAGSGVRGVRFLLELPKNKIKKISFNDKDPEAIKIIKKNIKDNDIKAKKDVINITNQDANLFLLNSTGFDYIDIDPFGSPNPFLDSSIKRISRDGILAVTATDTGCLCGSFSAPCLRKYWAKPLRNELMHEIGLRIFIRKIQLIGAQAEKALIPILSYNKDHYFRIFFRVEKGRQKVDKLMKFYNFLLFNNKTGEFKLSKYNSEKGFNEYAGPIWIGELVDKALIKKINNNIKDNSDKELIKFLEVLGNESNINTVGFYDIHAIIKRNKIKNNIKTSELINKIENSKHKACRSHFSRYGIKSSIGFKEFIKLLKK
ncbi:hypothetical protein ACFL0W_04360 [Nanoarchaeota archaeon]